MTRFALLLAASSLLPPAALAAAPPAVPAGPLAPPASLEAYLALGSVNGVPLALQDISTPYSPRGMAVAPAAAGPLSGSVSVPLSTSAKLTLAYSFSPDAAWDQGASSLESVQSFTCQGGASCGVAGPGGSKQAYEVVLNDSTVGKGTVSLSVNGTQALSLAFGQVAVSTGGAPYTVSGDPAGAPQPVYSTVSVAPGGALSGTLVGKVIPLPASPALSQPLFEGPTVAVYENYRLGGARMACPAAIAGCVASGQSSSTAFLYVVLKGAMIGGVPVTGAIAILGNSATFEPTVPTFPVIE